MNKVSRGKKLQLFYLAFIIHFFATILLVKHGEGIHKNILYYGFPDTFLTIYTPEYFSQYESYSVKNLHHPFPFTVDIAQFVINVVIIWFLLLLFYKVWLKFREIYKNH